MVQDLNTTLEHLVEIVNTFKVIVDKFVQKKCVILNLNHELHCIVLALVYYNFKLYCVKTIFFFVSKDLYILCMVINILK